MKSLLKNLSVSSILSMTTFLDRVIFVFLIVLAITGFIFVRALFPTGTLVNISVNNKPVYLLPLNEDKIVSVKGLLGDSVIEIKNNMVHIKDSPCPKKLCVHEGWKNNGSIVCLPNRVVITVSGTRDDEQYDAVSK